MNVSERSLPNNNHHGATRMQCDMTGRRWVAQAQSSWVAF